MSFVEGLLRSALVRWDDVHHRLILVDHEVQLWVSRKGEFVRWHTCYLCDHAGLAEDFFHPSAYGHCRICGTFWLSHI